MNKTILNLKLIKFIFLLLTIGQFNFSAIGQITLSESFDGATFLPTGWSSVGTSTLWSRRTTGTFPTCANHSGAGMARFAARGSAAKTIQTIATPVFDLSNRGSNTPKVSLWIYRDNGSTLGDSLSLYVNNTNSLTSAVCIGTIARYSKLKMPDTVASNGWYQYTFTIPAAFKGASNFILFKGIGEAGYNIHIDDVQWEEYANLCTGTPTPGTISATNSIICEGIGTSILSLTGQTTGFSGLSFQWKSSSSATGPFVNFGTNVTALSTGTITSSKYYKCIATCSYSSKLDSTTVKNITVYPNPNPIISVTPATANFCQGSSVPTALKAICLTAKSFLWSPSTGLNRADTNYVNSSPTATTVYTVIGIDSLGCKGSTSVTVTLRQPPFVTITASDSIMCFGDSVKLTANVGGGGNTFLWVPTGQTVNSIFAKPTNKVNYTVTVRNSFNCATTLSKNLFVKFKPHANFGYKLNGRRLDFIDSSVNGVSHEWDFGDGNGSKKQNPIYMFVNDGNYIVQHIVNNPPCTSDTIFKVISIGVSSIHKSNFNSALVVSPNPVKNVVKITLSNNKKHELVVCNFLGEKVLIRDFSGSVEMLDMTGLVAGIYNLSVTNNGEFLYCRLMKVD